MCLCGSTDSFLSFLCQLHENETFWNSLKQIQKVQRQAGFGASVVWVWLGRIGQPEDCAGLVSFLCSPDASYINGENIVVAGFSPQL
ncbi:hypothetical protein MC885_016866 [Smutsia gigantea]|nr:hypothetical protein MC885_016866 [Smutsia gigantea]